MPYLYHSFVSPKTDGTDQTKVKPSNWNSRLQYSNFGDTGPAGTDAIVREILTGSRSYYVRSDGSNSNSGLADTSTGAFLTPQYAADIVRTLDYNGNNVTVNLQSSTTFNSGIHFHYPWVGGGTLTFAGGSSSTTLSPTGNDAFHILGALPGNLSLQNMKLQTSGSGFKCISHDGTGSVQLFGVHFGASDDAHIEAGTPGAYITVANAYTISGNAANHVHAIGGRVYLGSNTITLTSTPAFSNAFVNATQIAYVDANGTVFSGGATGTRYLGDENSVIKTTSGSSNFFPGNADGSVTTGAQYI